MKTAEKKVITEWNFEPDSEGNIQIPDYIYPLFNRIGFQFRFHTLSGHNELVCIARSCAIAEEFFKKRYEQLLSASEPEMKRFAEWMTDNFRRTYPTKRVYDTDEPLWHSSSIKHEKGFQTYDELLAIFREEEFQSWLKEKGIKKSNLSDEQYFDNEKVFSLSDLRSMYKVEKGGMQG